MANNSHESSFGKDTIRNMKKLHKNQSDLLCRLARLLFIPIQNDKFGFLIAFCAMFLCCFRGMKNTWAQQTIFQLVNAKRENTDIPQLQLKAGFETDQSQTLPSPFPLFQSSSYSQSIALKWIQAGRIRRSSVGKLLNYLLTCR